MFELVIFDCDGVLVDSEPLAVRVDAIVLARLGWPLTEAEIIERFVGRTDEYVRAEVSRQIGRGLKEDWDAEFTHLYEEAFRAELEPVAGVKEALDAIQMPTCVASNGSHRKMKLTLSLTGLHNRFQGRIFSADDVAHGKPAPDLFLHAAKTMGAAPAQCAVIEDSRSGIEAAHAAGMTPFAFAGGLTPATSLQGPGTTVFNDMRRLPRLLHDSQHAG